MSTTTSATTGTTTNAAALLNSSSTSTTATKTNETADRFLKLLVTQMQNQDPLNPMDNAEITSQMAQINTVTGIEKLNTTMSGMSTSFTQLQLLQGASLVGHNVWLEGNQLPVDSTGTTSGGYDLASSASNVRIDILNRSGKVIDSITESGLAAGRHGFSWTAPEGTDATGLTFKVTATTGNTAIGTTQLMQDRVDAISTQNGALTLELQNKGSVSYSAVKAIS